MKNFLRKIIMVLSISIMLFGCGTTKKATQNLGKSSMYSTTQVVNMRQIDSICRVDELPNISQWIKSDFRDFETGATITKRLYIKDLSNAYEMRYILMQKDTLYKMTKIKGLTNNE